jgi:hypothetical protein
MPDPKQKLTESLTEFTPDLVDTFSDISTKEELEFIEVTRINAELTGLEIFKKMADNHMGFKRSWQRMSRRESLLGMYQSLEMYQDMVGVASESVERESTSKRGKK